MFLTQVCQALERSGIRYAIVGGYAVALHGALRGTVDLDLVLSLRRKSFVEAEKAFSAIGLRSRLPVTAEQVFDFRKEYMREKNLVAWSFFDPVKPAHQLDVIITHDASKFAVKTVVVQGVRIRIATIRELIKMKTLAGRPQDLEDIKALRELDRHEK